MWLTTVSRAIWRNDISLLRNIASRSEFVRSLVSFNNGQVTPVCNATYANEVAQAKLAYPASQEESLPDLAPKQKANRGTLLASLVRLWLPSCRFISLQGVHTAAGVAHDRLQQTKALADFWRPTFGAKEFRLEAATEFLDAHAKPYCFVGRKQVNADLMLDFMGRLRDSEVGPDGLPYSAWRAAGVTGCTTLMGIYDEMISGRAVDLEFNYSRAVSLKKGDKQDDNTFCCRWPAETRPLGLQNSDKQIISGTVCFVLREPQQYSTHRTQRGFVNGRQLTRNVLDLDSASRIFANSAGNYNDAHATSLFRQRVAATPLFDYAAAFPSLLHGWIFLS